MLVAYGGVRHHTCYLTEPKLTNMTTPKNSASRSVRRLSTFVFGIVLAWLMLTRSWDVTVPLNAQSTCGPLINPVVCENQKTGDPGSIWDINGAGDPTIQGFATNISVTTGQTESFKIDTDSNNYTINIYRMGFYGGMGARKMATIAPSAPLPQNQPNCLTDATTGLIDCGNWGVSASWLIPTDAVSGIYFALLTRVDTGGQSHIPFIVRESDTASHHSDIVFQTSDTTWQAYNQYGGNSLYVGNPAGRAYKVSYNRPFTTRGTTPEDFLFNAEYPMVRWLEANGYDVSYISGVDTDRFGPTILTPSKHKVFMSTGHDEYWSGVQRANVEAARAAGLHLAFFSGNEIFWKTRWEASTDGSNTPYRTLVTYKETHANAKIDPTDPPTWTGTWRDPRFSPPADGGRPENALTGTIFKVNSGTSNGAIVVPAAMGKMRFWRNTTVATLPAGSSATLTTGTLGYEWDEEPNNGFRPPGLMRLSSTTLSGAQILLDYGSTYGSGSATHNLTLYRHASGALVFGAGTVQWSWGLDANHDRGNAPADVRMKQAMVNLLADMGTQPSTLQSGLMSASASTDTLAPTSIISSPAPGSSFASGATITVTGTASDSGGGIVAGVEVSLNNGATWAQATGTTSWTFTGTVSGSGSVTIKSRGYDDSGNTEIPSTGVTINVTAGPCCSIWDASTVPPGLLDDGDTSSVELGTKFRTDTDGFITAVRFYKGSANTGTHRGSLWTAAGTLLGTVTFTGETASGWQQANFATAIPITANTTYVVSYHAPVGHYTGTDAYFGTAVDNPPLHALQTGADGPNGLYAYGANTVFPTNSFNAENYWADVVFTSVPQVDTTPPTVTSKSPSSGATAVDPASAVTVTFSEPMNAGTISSGTFELRDPSNNLITATVSYDSVTKTATLTPGSALAFSTTYTALVKGGPADPRVKDLAGNAMAANVTWSFTTAATLPPPTCPCTIWLPGTVPNPVDDGDASSVVLGTRFRSDIPGNITGARFYKGALNTGTHVATLWTNTGTQLATATFTGETASGWQQVSFATPVPIAANTTYVISYLAPKGHYSGQDNYFTAAGVDNLPLHALKDATDGPNGVYAYSTTNIFPTQTFLSEGYFVDVVFNTNGPDTVPPTISALSASAIGTSTATITWTTNEPADSAVHFGTDSASLTQTASNPALVTSHNVGLTGLTPNTTYFYRVTSADAAGNLATLPATGQPASLKTLVAVPSVVNLTQAAATTAVTSAGLVVGTVTTSSSATVAAGSVISQNPAAGTSVASGSAVNLVVSTGPAPVNVPNVVNLTQAAATTAITGAGLVVGTVTTASSATVAAGSVISESPAAGTSVASGSAVNLVVSTGPPPVNVPNVVNLTQAAATTAITGAGLVVGTVTTASSATVAAGSVISESPAAGTSVASGSAVSLVVSLGPAPVSVPSVANLTQAAATSAITSAGLVVGTVTTASSATVAAGSVISQSPAAGTSVASGSAVNLVVSTGPAPVSVPNVVNLTQAAATSAITGAGLVVGTVTTASSATVAAGSVINQSPAPGTSVASGSAVNLIVSTGPLLVSVPNVVGLTQAAATTAITNATLVVGSVTTTPSATVPAGSVVTQNPAAGASVASGSAVNLVVSTGPAPVGITVDANVSTARSTNATTIARTVSTTAPNELLLALIATDNVSGSTTITNVATTGLTWQLVRRTNTQRGTSEIWRTFATTALTNVTVTATISQSVAASLTVMSFKGVDATGTSGSGAIGATGSANANPGAPTASLITTRAGSLVVGVGNDWDNATPRTLGPSQTLVQQFLATGGDTFWVQRTTSLVSGAGSTVTINDTAPATDRYNLTICEILAAP